MFERFTKEARQAVTLAQSEARELRHDRIGTEHVLLGLLAGTSGPAVEALHACGLESADVRVRVARHADPEPYALDAEALAAIGIDLDRVREATEAGFGEGALEQKPGRGKKGHIPFTREAKKVLELSLRHAIRLQQKHLGTGHILLGLIHDEDTLACLIMWEAGVDLGELRADVTRRLRAAAA